MRPVSAIFLFVWAFAVCGGGASMAGEFGFVALGDMPYGNDAGTIGRFEALVAAINRLGPRFTLHVGDFKHGATTCSDTFIRRRKALLNTIEGPVVYTPGDNEWTDCSKGEPGPGEPETYFQPSARLDFLRKEFFPDNRSLGRSPMVVERQADVMDGAGTYVENARFEIDGVHVVTAHVVGANNNLRVWEPGAVDEFTARDAADRAWLADSFRLAGERDARALVLAIHADMFAKPKSGTVSGFGSFLTALIAGARSFGRPVLLVFGDGHEFRVFRPFPVAAGNVVALEVFGHPHMHAVEVMADPANDAVFAIRPLFNPRDTLP